MLRLILFFFFFLQNKDNHLQTYSMNKNAAPTEFLSLPNVKNQLQTFLTSKSKAKGGGVKMAEE